MSYRNTIEDGEDDNVPLHESKLQEASIQQIFLILLAFAEANIQGRSRASILSKFVFQDGSDGNEEKSFKLKHVILLCCGCFVLGCVVASLFQGSGRACVGAAVDQSQLVQPGGVDPPATHDHPSSALLPPKVQEELKGMKSDLEKLVDYHTAGAGKGMAYKRTADFVDRFGHRFTGSANLESSIDHLESLIKEDGFEDVHFESVSVPRWVRGNENCQLLMPLIGNATKKLPMLGLGFSVGTGEGGVTSEVVVVSSFEDLVTRSAEVRGKIVLFNFPWTKYGECTPYRYLGASFAAKYGAVAVLIRSLAAFSLSTPHTGSMGYIKGIFNANSAKNYNAQIPEALFGDYAEVAKIPSAAITAEDAAMLQRMQERGQKIVVQLHMGAQLLSDVPSRNTVVEIKGSKYPNEVVIVSGHVDSWDVGQGAIDDAGPSFVAYQVVKAVKDLRLKPKRTLRMIFWTAEEVGVVGGLQYYEDHKSEAEQISMVIELDYGIFTPTGASLRSDAPTLLMMRAVGETLARIGGSQVFADAGFTTSDMGKFVSSHQIPALTVAQVPK
eukprot:766710-Hanusia_phi.AAC.10